MDIIRRKDIQMKDRGHLCLTSKEGIALLMVMWVLTILTVIVLSFSYMTRTETLAALTFRKGLENKLLAEAGVERAIMEAIYRASTPVQMVVPEGLEIWKADGTPYKIQVGEDSFEVRITDESGKVDINAAPEVILRNLLAQLGVKMEDADTIVDSIMDWKDSDDLHRLHGAESDYYMSLKNPYKAKNANFETLEELILVKGVTHELLYGDKDRKGIAAFLTVNSKTDKINVSSAPKEVLFSIPGISSEIVDAILAQREANIPIDIKSLAGQNYSLMSPFIVSGGSSNAFSIESTGHTGTGKNGYSVKATVVLEGSNKYKYVYYKSPAGTQ